MDADLRKFHGSFRVQGAALTATIALPPGLASDARSIHTLRLVSQGDPGDEFVILLEGSVKVELLTPEGKELTLTMLKAFQFFGELALFDDMPRSASVSALEETRVMALGKEIDEPLLGFADGDRSVML